MIFRNEINQIWYHYIPLSSYSQSFIPFWIDCCKTWKNICYDCCNLYNSRSLTVEPNVPNLSILNNLQWSFTFKLLHYTTKTSENYWSSLRKTNAIYHNSIFCAHSHVFVPYHFANVISLIRNIIIYMTKHKEQGSIKY